jgi:glycosyltransferase involved in cell wall biosynthesis
MAKKTILMLLNEKFLPDIRVEQEYKSLINSGYEVYVVANTKGVDNKGFNIIRISCNGISCFLYRLFFFVGPKLKSKYINSLKNNGLDKIDVVHVHDLIWAELGHQISRYYGAKLILDLHENYPAWTSDKRKEVSHKKNIINFIKAIVAILLKFNFSLLASWLIFNIRTPKFILRYEDNMLKKADKFITVVEEALLRFKNKPYFSKGIIVSNTKNPKDWDFKKLPSIKNKIIVSYVGTVQNLRGLDTAIQAMSLVNQDKYRLEIVGIKFGSEIHNKFLKIIKNNNLTNVSLVNYIQDEKKAFEYIFNSHIGIIPHKSTGLTETTVPHKLFMYMATGRPVLVSDVAPLKRIICDSKCGSIFKADSPQSFADNLVKMSSKEILNNYANNARFSAINSYNWTRDEEKLIDMYTNLLTES